MAYDTHPLSLKKHERVLKCVDIAKTLIQTTQKTLDFALKDISKGSQLQIEIDFSKEELKESITNLNNALDILDG